VPYRYDRVLVLYLAIKAARHGATFRGDLHEITEMFDVRWRQHTILRRLRRVVYCWYERPDNSGIELCNRIGLVQRFHVERDESFSVILTSEFMREIEDAAPISLPIVRRLAERPGALDLYLWQALRIHRGEAATVALFGPDGPLAVLPSATDRSRARQDICDRNATIRQLWPECPYRVSADGTMLIYDPPAIVPEPSAEQTAEPSPTVEPAASRQIAAVRPTLADSTTPRSSAQPAPAARPGPVTAPEPRSMLDPAALEALRQLRDTLQMFVAPEVEPTPESKPEPGPAQPGPQTEASPEQGRPARDSHRSHAARKRKRYRQRASRRRNRG
jgi:hypothetical protein